MKHNTKVVILILLTLLIGGFALGEEAHVHDYFVRDETEATCTKNGVIIWECKYCGYTYNEVYENAYGHKWGSWKTTKNATCTSAGKQSRSCKRCGKTETRSTGSLGHKYGSWSVIRAATCTQQGQRSRKCRTCGYINTETINTLPHSYGEWLDLDPATDHSSGTRSHSCTVCGYVETTSYDPEGTLRRKDSGEAVKELQRMLVCRGLLNEWGVDGSYGPGTENAVKQFQESEGLIPDGTAWPQTQSRLGHVFGKWNILSKLTDFSAGYKERTCEICGYTEKEETFPNPMLKRGDRGDQVKRLQQALNDAGYSVGYVDGDYGGMTERAVKSFQEANALTVDGIAWPGVLKLLSNDLVPPDNVLSEAETPLLLEVTQVSPAQTSHEEGDCVTIRWELTYDGDLDCTYWHIKYHESTEISEEHLIAAGTLPIKAQKTSTQAGTYTFVVHKGNAKNKSSEFIISAWGTDEAGSNCESKDVSLKLSFSSTEDG